MLSLLQYLARKVWHTTCLVSLAPLLLKSTDQDVGKWHTSQWSWSEAAAPAVGVLLLEGAARCAYSRCCTTTSKPLQQSTQHSGSTTSFI